MLAFSSAIEALRLANRVLGYEAFKWRLVSDNGGAVRASCGLSVLTDSHLAMERKGLFGTGRPSMAIVCADLDVEDYSNRSLEAWLRECRHRGIHIGALGTGTYVLAKAGLLDNKRCTIHWEKLPGFAERFTRPVPNSSIYEVDGKIWTCAGGSASFDMMMHLIERDFGEQTAAAICEQALVERVRAPGERQRLHLSPRHGISNKTVIKAVEQMELHMAEPLSMDDLAARLGLSRRQIERLFRYELECSPVRYYRELRLERARLLLTQSTMLIVDIAVACGFISASHFSKCYRETNGTSPQEARRTTLRQSPHRVTSDPAIANVRLPRKILVEAA
ncbi:GlxA family transcriptional regulator [Mesorhizobium sp. M0011]|uniref:GlxA family transcriptional regulator n=1 Tax=Mesorhizobium sp. M0011 TaxID=2956839 RepID=UPI00333B153B